MARPSRYTKEEISKAKSKEHVCPVCGKETKWVSSLNKYSTFCSNKCRLSKEGQQIVQHKMASTCLEKYGVTNVNKLNKTIEKRKKTNLEKYGVESTNSLKSKRDRIKKTNLEKYGGTAPIHSDKVKEKIKKSLNDKYGVEHIWASKEIQEQRKQNNLEKYGVEIPSQSEEIKEKVKQNNLEKYGVEYPIQTIQVKEKIKKSMIDKYGVDNIFKHPKFIEENKIKIFKTKKAKYFNLFKQKLLNKEIEILFSKEEYINDKYNDLKFKCLNCGNIFTLSKKRIEKYHFNVQNIFCDKNCHASSSIKENEVFNFVAEIYNKDIIRNKKFKFNNGKKLEIDIYIPELNIGIEYHGLYFHSDLKVGKTYHQNKYKKFKDEHNIQIIQIFANEWEEKRDIVKSLIRNKLSKDSVKINARECNIEQIKNEDSNLFHETNHIQGSVIGSKYNFALRDKSNEIVSVLSIGVSRFNQNFEWEILRYTVKKNHNVRGGFQKLLKHFKKELNPQNIISYCDVRFFNGVSYINSGFNEEKLSSPNYWYAKNDKVIGGRLQFQKHKLNKLLDNFDPSLSEYENMLNNKYVRVYDAGNLVFTWEQSKEGDE